MDSSYDIAIIGGGFGGSLLAMVARRIGLSVLVLEREHHPRFAIGESSTPLANLLLGELAVRYDLPAVRPLAKWGTWQSDFPDVACGLKRGFTFFHHEAGQPWRADGEHELLVAASPHDRIADTHWYRPDFDAHLLHAARSLGADCREGVLLERLERHADGWSLGGGGTEGAWRHQARWLVDGSGPRGALHQLLGLGEAPFPEMPATRAVFGHFRNVARWDEMHSELAKAPYPVDDAALHHVFEGGWIWVLRFNNGITSAGVAAREDAMPETGAPEAVWQDVLARFPSVRAQFADATPVLPMRVSPRLSFRSRRAAGEGWVLLPSAAGVVDPLLSSGFTLNLLGLERLARMLEEGSWEDPGLQAYERDTFQELDDTAQLVGALYASMGDFPLFAELTKLYFGAVTYTETMRRLGHAARAGRLFMLGEREGFRQGRRDLCRAVQGGEASDAATRERLLRAIRALVAPIDVAGLTGCRSRRHYPARAEDVLAASDRLGVSQEEIRAMLVRCGMGLSG